MDRSYPALVILLFLFSPLCKVRFKTKMMLRAPPPRPALKKAKRKVRACTFFFSASVAEENFLSLFLAKVPANCKRGEKGGKGREMGSSYLRMCHIAAIELLFFSVTLWRRRMGRYMLFQGTLVVSSEKFYVPFRYDNCTLLFKSFPENLTNTFLFR